MGRAQRVKYRHLRRTVIAVLATLAFLLAVWLGVITLLKTATFKSWAITLIEQRIAGTAGVGLEIEDLDYGLLPPRILLKGVRLATQGLSAEIDAFSLDLFRIRLTKRRIDLQTVTLSGVRIRAEEIFKSKDSRTSPVTITVDNLDIRDLYFQGLDVPGLRSITLDDLDLSWVGEKGSSRGFFEVERINLELPGLNPIECGFKGRFDFSESLRVPYWAASGDGFALTGDASVQTNSDIRARAEGVIELPALDETIKTNGLFEGLIEVQVRLATSEEEFIRVDIDGPQIDVAGFRVDRLKAQLGIAQDHLRGVVEDAVFAGGQLRGVYELKSLNWPYPHEVTADLEGCDLRAILHSIGVPSADLSARTDVSVGLQWNSDLIGEGRGEAAVEFTPGSGLLNRSGLLNGSETLPVSGGLDVVLEANDLLHFSSRDLSIGDATVGWQGPLALGTWAPEWSIRARNAPIEQWSHMVNAWIGDEVIPETVTGIATIATRLSGPWSRLLVSLRLDAVGLAYGPIEIDRVVAEAKIADSKLVFDPLRFGLGDGFGEISGHITWAEGPAVIDMETRGQSIPIAELAAWADADDEVEGRFSFTGRFSGPLSAPRGSWAVGLTDVVLAGLNIGDGSTGLAFEEQSFSLHGLCFDSGLEGKISWQVASGAVDVGVHWPVISLTGLGQTGMGLLGSQMGFDSEFRWMGEGIPEGWLRAGTDRASFEARCDEGHIVVNGSIGESVSIGADLEEKVGGEIVGRTTVAISAVEDILSQILADAKVPLTGGVLIDAGVQWTAQGELQLVGSMSPRQLDLDGRSVKSASPTDFVLNSQGLQVLSTEVDIGNDSLVVEGMIASDGALSGHLGGTIDALLLRIFAPEWETAGRLVGDFDFRGTLADPRLQGVAEIEGVSFRLPGGRSVVSGVSGMVLLTPEDIILDGVDFRFMNGTGRSSGRIELKDSEVWLSLNGSMTGLVYPLFSGLEPQVSGTWSLFGAADDLELSGDLVINRAGLLRRDDLAEMALDWIEEMNQPSEGAGVRLDLHLEADRSISARGPFLNAAASASLDLFSNSDQLGLVGKIELHEGGDFTFQGVRYEIERGSIAFSDPERLDRPIVEFDVRAWVQSYVITVRLSGALDRLAVAVSSDPPLDPEGIYSLLSLGYRDESIGTGGFGVGLASTVLTRQINDELGRRARLLLPVDQVRVDPFIESSTGNPAARMTVTKQLSPKWTVIMQSNLSSDREEVFISRWYLASGVFIEAIRDLDGTIGIDFKVRKRY